MKRELLIRVDGHIRNERDDYWMVHVSCFEDGRKTRTNYHVYHEPIGKNDIIPALCVSYDAGNWIWQDLLGDRMREWGLDIVE